MLMMPYFMGVALFSSTLSFPKATSFCSPASSSMTGLSIRQGPHQAAQQSSTATSLLLMNYSKFQSVTSSTISNTDPFL